MSAVAAIVHDLARAAAPSYHPPGFDLDSKGPAADQNATGIYSLPGGETAAKKSLELELSALAARIHYLESKASTIGNQALPDTPNEFAGVLSPFSTNGSSNAVRNNNTMPIRSGSGSARNAHVLNLLAGRTNGRAFSEEDLAHLREHVEKQAQEIKSQRDTVASVGEQLREQQEKAARTIVNVQNEDINILQRELWKHQQANEAFQKALQEIGTIITNVANGDLSHKVQIHVKEMDPEIQKFKRTINTMMDQLQIFGSEVSRVAREVGTEGNLGGQAQITGVSGIWKELTENGKSSIHAHHSRSLTLPSQHHGKQSHPSSARDCRGHYRRRQRRPWQKNPATCSRGDFGVATNH